MSRTEVQQSVPRHRLHISENEWRLPFSAKDSKLPNIVCRNLKAVPLPEIQDTATQSAKLLTFARSTLLSLSSNTDMRLIFSTNNNTGFYFRDFQNLAEAQNALKLLPGSMVAIVTLAKDKLELLERCNELSKSVAKDKDCAILGKLNGQTESSSLFVFGKTEECKLIINFLKQAQELFELKYDEFGVAVTNAKISQGVAQTRDDFRTQVIKLYRSFAYSFFSTITSGGSFEDQHKSIVLKGVYADEAIKDFSTKIPPAMIQGLFDWLVSKELIRSLALTKNDSVTFPEIKKVGSISTFSQAVFTHDEISGIETQIRSGAILKERFILTASHIPPSMSDILRLSHMPLPKGIDSIQHPGILQLEKDTEHFYTYSGLRFNQLLNSNKIASAMFELLQLQSALQSNLEPLMANVDTTLASEKLSQALKSCYDNFGEIVGEQIKKYGAIDIDTIIDRAKKGISLLAEQSNSFRFSSTRVAIDIIGTKLVEQIVISVAKSTNILVDFHFYDEDRQPLKYIPTLYEGRLLEHIAKHLSGNNIQKSTTAYIEDNWASFGHNSILDLQRVAYVRKMPCSDMFVQNIKTQLIEFKDFLDALDPSTRDAVYCFSITGPKREELGLDTIERNQFNSVKDAINIFDLVVTINSELQNCEIQFDNQLLDKFISKWQSLFDNGRIVHHLDEVANEMLNLLDNLSKNVLQPNINRLQHQSGKKIRGGDKDNRQQTEKYTKQKTKEVLEVAKKLIKESSLKLVNSTLVEQLFFNSRDELLNFREVFKNGIDLPALYKLKQATELDTDNFIHGFQNLNAYGADLSPQSYLKLLEQFRKYEDFIGITAGDQERDGVIITRLFTLLKIEESSDIPAHTRIIFDPAQARAINDALISTIATEPSWNNRHLNTSPFPYN